MKLRISMPRVGARGVGLGNELTSWARAFLGAQVVDAHAMKPAFGLNKRRYWRHFGTPRYDWFLHQALEHLLPVVEFKEVDYLRHGGGNFVDAFRNFADTERLHDRSCYLLVTEGMWGGYRHIADARDFVFSTLYQSRFAVRNLLCIKQRLHQNKLVVAMHVRLGDFGAAPHDFSDYRGRFNLALPLFWYINIAKSITTILGDKVQFLVVSDGSSEQLKPLLDVIPAVTTTDIPDSDCSDLLALAKADLLVCSVSSYSAWAAFLSDAPYLWFEPNLQHHDAGYYSIWGHEPEQQKENSATQRALLNHISLGNSNTGRGLPIGLDGVVPEELLQSLIVRKEQLRIEADLVQYGVVPIRKVGG